MTNVNIVSNSAYVGALVGVTDGVATNDTYITNCSVQGSVSGVNSDNTHVGGLVGYNSGGIVKNCAYLDGNITSSNGGAIVGKNTSTLTDNYYCGKLEDGVKDNGTTQIFNVNLPEGVTSSSIVTFGDKKYLKDGEASVAKN